MSHPLNEIVAQPLQQVANELAEVLSAADMADILGTDATRLPGRQPRLAVLRLALVTDTLRTLAALPGLDLGPTPRLNFIAPYLVGSARILAATLPGNESLAGLKRENAGEFLTEYMQDLAPYGGANVETAWIGLRLCREAARLTRFGVLMAHRGMLLRLIDAVLEQPSPLTKTEDDNTSRETLRIAIAEVLAEPNVPQPDEPLTVPIQVVTGRLGPATCTAFSPDGRLLAVGTEGGGLFLLSRSDDSVVAGVKIPEGVPVTALTFVRGTPWLLFTGEDLKFRLLDLEVGISWWKRTLTSEVHQILDLPTGDEPPAALLGIDERGMVLALSDEAPPLRGHRRIPAFSARRVGICTRFAVDPGGRLLAAIEMASGFEGHEDIRLIDFATGERLGTLVGHSDVVSDLAFSPRGRLLASCGYDGTVRLWDSTRGTEIGTITIDPKARLTSLAFTPDGTRLVVGSGEHTDSMFKDNAPSPRKGVFVIDVARGEIERTIATPYEVEGLALHPAGNVVALIGLNESYVFLRELDGEEDPADVEIVRPQVGTLMGGDSDLGILAELDNEPDEEFGEIPGVDDAIDIDAEEHEVEDDPLRMAVRAGDLDGLERELSHGAVVNRFQAGRTALHVAAELGHRDMAARLLEAGADSFARDHDDHTPRWVALANGQRGVADLFRERGELAEDELQLLEAIRGDDAEDAVRALLEAGADPDGRVHATSVPEDVPPEAATPMTQTAYHGDEAVLELLLGAGADIARQDEVPLSPWGAAITGNQPGAAALLVIHGAIPDPNPGLIAAIRHGNFEAIDRFLEAGADVNFPSDDGSGTPLRIALESERNDLALRLVNAGARVEPLAVAGYSMLHLALGNLDRATLVRELLARGLDADERDDDGRPALLRVARQPEVDDAFDTAVVLLEGGAKVNARDEAGRTALHQLGRNKEGGVALAELFIAFGADPALTDGKDRTPLKHARKKENIELVDLLKNTALLASLPRRLTQPQGAEEVAWRGLIRIASGRWAEAVADYETAIRLDPEMADPARSDWFNQRARAHDELGNGRPGQALRHYGQAHGSPLMTSRLAHYRIADVLDPDFWCAGNNLAWCAATWPIESMRDGAMALRYAREVEARLPGPCWSPLDTLAAALAASGKFEEAVAAVERSLLLAPPQEQDTLLYNRDRYRRGLGWRDPENDRDPWTPPPFDDWLTPIDRLLRQGAYEQAITESEAAVAGGSPTLDMQIDLGRALLAWDRTEEALPHFERAAGQLERDGEVSIRRLRVLVELSAVRVTRRMLPEARTALEQAITVAESALEVGHPLQGELLVQRGNLCIFEGNFAEGDELLQQALAFCADHLDSPHVTTSRCLASLAQSQLVQGNPEEALTLLVDVIDGLEQLLGPRHPRVAFALAILIEGLVIVEEPVRAIPYARHALEILEATLGENHPLTEARRAALDRCIDLVNDPPGEEPT